MTRPLPLSYDLYIAAPADAVWKAIVDADATEQYFFGSRIESRLESGARLSYTAGGAPMVEGEILEIERGRRLVARQRSLWDEAVRADPASVVSWELTAMGPKTTRLTLVHDGFDGATATYEQSAQGWPLVLSGMKTWVETGEALAMPGGA